MTKTPKYGLNKPGGSDYAKIQALNENADAIEDALDGLEAGKEALVKNAAEKSTPVDADSLALADSADDGKIKRVLWSKIKTIFAAATHNHDDRYYTETEIDTKLSGKLGTSGNGSDTTVQFTEASSRTAPATGESQATLWGKVKKLFSDLKTVAFSGSYADLSNIPLTFAPSSHTHGSLTNDGKIGTAADLPIFTGTGGALGTKTVAAARAALSVPSVAESTALLALPLWARIATYETAGTFTWTAPNLFGDGTAYEIGVWMCGGGGAGGANYVANRTTEIHIAVGGASGRARAFKMTVTPGQTYNLVVGAGGAAAAVSSSLFVNGNPGGSSAFNGIAVSGGEGGLYADLDTGGNDDDVHAAIGAQCSIGIPVYSTSVNAAPFLAFAATINPFGGVLVPYSVRHVSSGSIYEFWNLGMVGFSNECFDPFACTQRLAAGGGARWYEGTPEQTVTYPHGLDPATGLGGGAGSITEGVHGGDATAPGCGGGGLAFEKTSGTPSPSRNGAGKAGAVYIYARRLAA